MTTKTLIGWDIGVAFYLIAVSQLLAMGGVDYLRNRAAKEDEGRFGILVLTAIASLTSLGAIVALLGNTRTGERESMQLALAVVTILLSWGFIHVIFAVHYANEYYAAQRRKIVGMIFPKDDRTRLLGFPVFFIRDRDDVAGLRRGGGVEAGAPDGAGARHHLVLVQRHIAGAGR